MEYIIGIIIALLGGLVFYKKKADKAGADAKLAEAKGRDKELKQQQEDVEKAIKHIDDGIEKAKKEREERLEKEKNMTLKERADAARKKFNK